MVEIKKRVLEALRERAGERPVCLDPVTGRTIRLHHPDRRSEDVTDAVHELARAGVVRLDGDEIVLTGARLRLTA